MVRLKTKKEIELLAEGGRLLGELLNRLVAEVKPGVTGQKLDQLAQQWVREAGVKPSFLGYGPGGSEPFPAALCVSVNNAVVHGLPNNEPFKEGDIVGLDLGIVYKNLYLDAARTVAVGKISDEAEQLLLVTREALRLGIAAAKLGNTLGDIGFAVQEYVEAEGYGVVRQLVGHGVGYAVHEEPQVPNFGKAGKGLKLEEGLVIAIEPMVTVGNPLVSTAKDGWTVVTKDGSLAAHEEDTVAITNRGTRVLTRV